MGAIVYTPKASDLPTPGKGGGGSYNEIEVPADYELRFEAWRDYDKTADGGTKGWIFSYSCETPSGGSVTFDVWLPHSQMWKVCQHFDALGSPSVDDVKRTFDPNDLKGSMCGGHIDFPRDTNGEPSSRYREIRYVFPLPADADIQEIVEEVSTPEPVDLPEEVEAL